MAELLLVRHGETAWSVSGRHTGRTDVPLTDEGQRQASRLRHALEARTLERVISSPLARAAETCRLAGGGDRVELRDELLEWDYGEFEGLTTAEIREARPGWLLWRDGCPGGESAEQVTTRLEPLLQELWQLEGDAALFAHGHVLRALAALWIGLSVAGGSKLALSTASVSVLGWERELPVLRLWNSQPAA